MASTHPEREEPWSRRRAAHVAIVDGVPDDIDPEHQQTAGDDAVDGLCRHWNRAIYTSGGPKVRPYFRRPSSVISLM